MAEKLEGRLVDELSALDQAHVMGTYARQPAAFVRGEGATLYDADGEAYLDFLAGIAVCNTGTATRASSRRSATRPEG